MESVDQSSRLPVLGAAPAPSPDELRRRLARTMGRTIGDHELIREGDRILVAVSGGKDSATLLDLLRRAQRRSPVRFELLAFHLDQAQPGYDGAPLADWLASLDVPYRIEREDTYGAVIEDAARSGSTYCRLCSRLRRGILSTWAERLECTTIALGHHRDDALQTLLMNLFYSGRLQAMPAGYTTNDGRHRVIRPLIECAESMIGRHAAAAGYPILPCNLCGSQTDMKRVEVERLLCRLERDHPELRSVMLAAIKNVRPSHLLDREVATAWAEHAAEYEPRR